jgi:ferritin-like metal-binding protein YciE
MAKTQRELLISWLNDAYSMEHSQQQMLERFIKDFDDQASIQEQLRKCLEDTKRHTEDVMACIERMGGKTSKTKGAFGTVSGMLQGVQSSAFRDQHVKNMLMLHAGGHFAHASYTSITTGARELGENDIAGICERIAKEELKMADWALDTLPDVTRSVLAEQEPAGT